MHKIYILGLAGSSKTFLGNKLSVEMGFPIYTTDWILYYKNEIHQKIKLGKEDYLKKIGEILNQDSWIVEGVHYFDELAQAADSIILIDAPLYSSVLGIINRFLNDANYRKTYNLTGALNLIRKTIVGYYAKPNENLLYYPKYKNRKKYYKVLEKYMIKTQVITSNIDYSLPVM